ncbi:hypothetical protein F5H01DRAFT_374817 [Linnemannia elongata]|nr:hypothetical protein F5H01DRAFT_374817 [Linnemannia elongata]
MDNDSNQEETLIQRHQQQQEQQRQQLQQQHPQQQQRQHPQLQQQHLRFDPRLGHHQGHNQILTSAFHPPLPFPQQHQSSSGIHPGQRQKHQQHPYGPFSMSTSSSSSVDPHSEQFMSSSSRNTTFTVQQQQYPTGPRGGRVAQGPTEEIFGFGGGGGMSAEAREQEAEALAIHRQYQQRLLQEQQQRRSSPSTPATPRFPATQPFQSQAPIIPHWQQQQQLQQPPQHVWHVQPSQYQTSSQQDQRGPVRMSSTPFLAPTEPTTTTGPRGSSPRLSSPTSGRRVSAGSSSSSFLSSHSRGGPVGFGRVNPYPPPQPTHRSQDHQYHRQSGPMINVDALPNLNPDPALRRHEHLQQQHQQQLNQRDIPPPLITSSRLQAGRAPFTSPPARLSPPPPPAYNFGGIGSIGSGVAGNGDGYDCACPHEPRPIEMVLPAQAPISIYGPRNSGGGMGDDGGAGGDLEMDYILEEEEQGPPPIEVTLNVDIPKSSRPPTEGIPSTTVLNVNPSWHVVFVETIQQQRIRTSIRIQFCPSSSTTRLIEHRSKVRRLQTIQVIGYASRRVELSRRIQGQTLLNRGGLIIHLDPASITFNEASYGFTLSLTSFEMDQLSRTRNSRPDIPLPLARQQNSAYCRRNLKEMYYDIISKDVAITLRPSGEVFYAHSVVLESHSYFRALIEQQNQSSQGSSMAAAGQDLEGEGTGMMAVETESVVDEEGYAQPLRPQPQQRSSNGQGSSRYSHSGGGPFCTGGGGISLGLASQDRSRAKIMIEVNDTSPTVFRAVLHFMYMGHVPVTGVFSNQAPPPPQQQTAASSVTAAQDAGSVSLSATTFAMTTATGVESGSSSAGMTGLEVLTAAATLAATEAASGTSSSSISGPSAALGASTMDQPMGPPPFPLTPIVTSAAAPTLTPGTTTTADNTNGNSNGNAPAIATTAAPPVTATTTIIGEFPWREVYEIATRYQLSGLMHLSKVALLSRLDVDRAIRELFEWAYHHKPLIPAYVSFLIERVDATVLNGRRSILWPYHDLCPAYDEIMMDFMRLLSERKNASTLV